MVKITYNKLLSIMVIGDGLRNHAEKEIIVSINLFQLFSRLLCILISGRVSGHGMRSSYNHHYYLIASTITCIASFKLYVKHFSESICTQW